LKITIKHFLLHVLSVVSWLCSLPTEPSPGGLQLGAFTFVHGDWHSKIWHNVNCIVMKH